MINNSTPVDSCQEPRGLREITNTHEGSNGEECPTDATSKSNFADLVSFQVLLATITAKLSPEMLL
jgi:hypothetical protein